MGIDDMIGETTFLGACDTGTIAYIPHPNADKLREVRL